MAPIDQPSPARRLAGVDQALGDGAARSPSELLDQLRERLARLDVNHPSAWDGRRPEERAETRADAVPDSQESSGKRSSNAPDERPAADGADAVQPASRRQMGPDGGVSQVGDPGSGGGGSGAEMGSADGGVADEESGSPSAASSADESGADANGVIQAGRRTGEPYRPWFAAGEPGEPWFLDLSP